MSVILGDRPESLSTRATETGVVSAKVEIPETYPLEIGPRGTWGSEGFENPFDQPIRLWEPFDDPHLERLYTDQSYFSKTLAQSPLGEQSHLLPHYEEIAKGAANLSFVAQLLDLPVEEVEQSYPEYRIGVSLALGGPEARDDGEFFDRLSDAARQNQTYQNLARTLVLATRQETTISDFINLGAKSSFINPITNGTEGVARASGNLLDDYAYETERKSTPELEQELAELDRVTSTPSLAIGGPGLGAALWDRRSDIDKVLKNRTRGESSSQRRDLLQTVAGVAGQMALHEADQKRTIREGADMLLPVTEEFRTSLPGQIYAGILEMPVNLAAYRAPGLGPLMSGGQVYNETYYDALEKGASPKQAHRAAMMSLPSMTVDILMDKLILARVLGKYEGKLSVRELLKTLGMTAIAGGSTEATQQLWQNVNAKYLSGYDPERLLDKDFISSFVIGMFVDASTSVGGQALTGALQRGAASPEAKGSSHSQVASDSNVETPGGGLDISLLPDAGSGSTVEGIRSLNNPFRGKNGKLNLGRRGVLSNPAESQAEGEFIAILNNQEEADQIYDSLPDSRGGKILNPDTAREVYEKYRTRDGRIAFTESTGAPAGIFMRDRLWREIINPRARKKLVFTSGGPGAGKTDSVNDALAKEADLVFDSTLRDTKWAKEMIDLAVENGWEVDIVYVQRPFDDVVRDVIERTDNNGRWFPLRNLPMAHIQAQRSILELEKVYKGNGQVEFSFNINGEVGTSRKGIDHGGKFNYYAKHERRELEGKNAQEIAGGFSQEALERGNREAFQRAVRGRRIERRLLEQLARGSEEFLGYIEDYYGEK